MLPDPQICQGPPKVRKPRPWSQLATLTDLCKQSAAVRIPWQWMRELLQMYVPRSRMLTCHGLCLPPPASPSLSCRRCWFDHRPPRTRALRKKERGACASSMQTLRQQREAPRLCTQQTAEAEKATCQPSQAATATCKCGEGLFHHPENGKQRPIGSRCPHCREPQIRGTRHPSRARYRPYQPRPHSYPIVYTSTWLEAWKRENHQRGELTVKAKWWGTVSRVAGQL